MTHLDREPSSFRDPAGFLYKKDKVIFRQVNLAGLADYQYLIHSGLYQQLVDDGLLIPHEEVTDTPKSSSRQVIFQPTFIPFISYPYEWCFSQLKDAALITLTIEKKALESGMTLKDASAFNVQFLKGRPIFIDTLSFESYQAGKPWDAYRQFCQHFLAPLALMAYVDCRLLQLFREYIDGIPLDLASRLLPLKTRLNLGLFIHLHLHARSQIRFSNNSYQVTEIQGEISLNQRLGLIANLENTIRKLRLLIPSGGWREYELFHNYSQKALENKKQIVTEYLEQTRANTVWDIGANTGVFSRLSSQRGALTIAFDMDPFAVEWNYRNIQKDGIENNLLPLVMDLTNPSPGLGWVNEERESLIRRGPADAVLALALIHHLAIGNNLPLSLLARFFQELTKWLIIEFVPKEDPQVSRLLQVRKDIFTSYNQDEFEREFSRFFDLESSKDIIETNRKIYLYKNKKTPN